jgi:hypothetical protein
MSLPPFSEKARLMAFRREEREREKINSMHRLKTTRGQSKRTLVVYEKYLLQKYLISAIPYAGIVSVDNIVYYLITRQIPSPPS